MHTILRSDTQAISIQAPPDAVLDLIAEPRDLPRWAPDFARAVRPEGELWVVDTGEGEVRRRIRVARELGTVDFLAPAGPSGFFARVLANGEGSELMFTQFFPAAMSEGDVERRRAVAAGELRAVQGLCEVRGVS